MPKYTIPTRYYSAFSDIRNLSDETIQELLRALEGMPLPQKIDAIPEAVAKQLEHVDRDMLVRVLDAVLALYVIRSLEEVPLDVFVAELVRSMSDTSDPRLDLATEEVPVFRDRLSRLLSVTVLNSAAKARVLRSDFPQTFCDAKILTDVRPVFGSKVDEVPVSIVITHTLKLSYHRDADHKEFYLSLEPEDLKELIDVINRAQFKERTLKSMLKSMGAADLD